MPIDYKKYHPKWRLISYLIRKVRASDHCEGSPAYPECRAENYQPHPITGSKVILTVAHLDQDRNNNRFWNLKAWCQRCHLRHDLKQHNNNRRYGRDHKRDEQQKIRFS